MGHGVGLSVRECLAPLAAPGGLAGMGRLVSCDAHVGGGSSWTPILPEG